MNLKTLGKKPRIDGQPGWRIITPTRMGYQEADNSDVRVRRVRVYGPTGNLEKTYLMDEMGVHFTDLPHVKDDFSFLELLRRSSREKI